MRVQAYAYDSDMHCPDCAAERFPACAEHRQVACDECYQDSEGNGPGASFWRVDGCAEYCGDCGEVIAEHDPIEPGTECGNCGMEGPTLEVRRVRFLAYCGMDSGEGGKYTGEDAETEARDECAAILRHRRKAGLRVSTLEPGKAWEVLEPDNCAMVPDDCGTLHLSDLTDR